MKKIIIVVFLFLMIFVASSSISSKVFAAITSDSFDVEVVVLYGDGEQANANLASQLFGTSVNINLSAFSEDFVYFIANGEVIDDENYQFRVTSDLYIVAVLKDASEIVSVFLDSNGQFIGADYLLSGETPVAPDVSSYSKPGYVVDTVNPWSPAISVLTDNEVYDLQYVLDTTAEFNIFTVNATPSNTQPAFNEIVTVTASDAEATSGYWMENGAVIAYGLTYSYSALSDRELTFVDSEDAEEPLVSYTDASGIRDGYDSFLGQLYLPDGYELVEYGFLFDTELKVLDTSNAEVIKASSVMASTNEFLRSFPENTYQSARAYAIVDNGSTLETIYSQRQLGYATDLLISEYIEGSSDNKAIEIYNGTGSTVDLSNYSVALYTNGSTTVSNTLDFAAETYLNTGDVYVIYYSSADTAIKVVGDVSSSVANFNGDDAIALLKNDLIIDVFGEVGNDPGSSWNIYLDESVVGQTADNTIVRKSDEFDPTIDWEKSFDGQWDIYDQDTFDYLGAHPGEISDAEKADNAVIDLNAPSEVELDMDYVLPTTELYGASVVWTSTNTGVIDIDGTITRPAYGSGNATATLSYTVSVGDEDRMGDIAVTVLEEPGVTTYVETFENFGSGSYDDGTFTGITYGATSTLSWTYVEARNESTYGIDGSGVLLRRNDEPSSIETTITGGVGTFSFDYRKAFTGSADRDYSIDITIDSVTTTYIITTFGSGSGAQDTIYEFELTLDTTSDVTIKIYATGDGQATFDNFTWSIYTEE